MSNAKPPWENLVSLWRKGKVIIRSGVSLSALREFESRYGVQLPSDLQNYFLTVDGMEDEFDPGMNRFWPLGLVKPVSDELAEVNPDRWAYPNCYVIADHLIWSLGWAIRLEETPNCGQVVQVTGGDKPGRIVASSFTAFVQMYLKDQYSIH